MHYCDESDARPARESPRNKQKGIVTDAFEQHKIQMQQLRNEIALLKVQQQ